MESPASSSFVQIPEECQNNTGRIKRPDSLKLELLSHIPENGTVLTFGHNPEGSVHVGFRNLYFTVTKGIFRKKSQRILHNVNGDFHAGELTAIMGPSGAGKSTLMNILAGYTRDGLEGSLLVNDEERDEYTFRKQSCYIMQDDNLQPLLTVQEAMTVAVNLKVSSSICRKEKDARVKEILVSMSLWENRKVKTCSLSGGQKKRLSIALEMLKNPQVMFFDEPTSGLDSLTSKQCVMLLKQLAATGRTIICTIHQPSAMIFEMFDHLYALAEGQCIYQGSVGGLLSYLQEANLKCPTYYNPADYLLEVASGDYGNYTEKLVMKSGNGVNSEWRKNQKNIRQFESLEHIDNLMQEGRITPVKAPSLNFPRWIRGTSPQEGKCCTSQYPTSFCNQLIVLLKRMFLTLRRDRTLAYSRLTTHLGIAIFIGILYYGIGKDASNMLNNFNFLFFTAMFLMLTAFNCVVTTFPSEMAILTREHFNKWYSLKSYYFAITMADIPIQMLATILYGVITYLLTMQPLETFRIFSFLFMCILVSLVAQSWGFFVGALLDLKNGVIFGPFAFLPFTIFSGFFVQLNSSPLYLRWMFHISFLRYGFEGLVLSVLGYNREKLPCNTEYCHFVYPKKFLQNMDMHNAQYSTAVIFLLGLTTLIRIGTYYALKAQISRRRPITIVS